MERRNLMGGSLAAGLAALVAAGDAPGASAAPAAAAAAAQQRDCNDEAVADAVQGVQRAVETLHGGAWTVIRKVREQQRIWLRANHRFPDFIEVGIDVWDGLYDWHVRYQQPIGMTRATDGRYVITFMFTTFLLRPDMLPDYVGPPFDATRLPSNQ
jgi:hypothetical protein